MACSLNRQPDTEKSSIVKGSVSSGLFQEVAKKLSQLGKLRKTISAYLRGTIQIVES